MPSVYKAEPYREGGMDTFGKANYMLIRQFQFPDNYDDRDTNFGRDSDRCFQGDLDRADACYKKHGISAFYMIETWVLRSSEAEVMALLMDILQAEEIHPGVTWTGFRVLGTVQRGFPIFTFGLFAQHPESDTVVYSENDAPNVMMLASVERDRIFLTGNSTT